VRAAQRYVSNNSLTLEGALKLEYKSKKENLLFAEVTEVAKNLKSFLKRRRLVDGKNNTTDFGGSKENDGPVSTKGLLHQFSLGLRIWSLSINLTGGLR
jgi:hypothetical protein